MKEGQPETTKVASLLGLYLEQKEELISSLDKKNPAKAAEQISNFIRSLERPYTDLLSPTDAPAYLVHHVLNTIAGASQTLLAVVATAAKPNLRKGGVGDGKRSRAIFYLWGVVLASVLSVILSIVNEPDPEVAPVVSFIVIAILATVGATTSSAAPSHHSSLTPKVTLRVDEALLDKKISHSLRVADELLGAASLANKEIVQQKNRLKLEPKRMLELLQALASHRLTSHPEKEASDLAGDAIRILYNAKVTPVEYTGDKAHFFEERPAGITEHRMLLPALIDEQGELVREGVVLIPAT